MKMYVKTKELGPVEKGGGYASGTPARSTSVYHHHREAMGTFFKRDSWTFCRFLASEVK